MNSKRQQALIGAAKSGKISEMYRLISSGADPFYFDKNGKNAFDYAVISDPIKTHILLNDLDKICTSPAKQEILKRYIDLVIKMGVTYEE
jgi:ankyrin repeat protein